MVSTNQSNTQSKNYDSEAEEKLQLWSDAKLLCLIPMEKESAIQYWNEANKQNASKIVREHFKNCMQRVQD